MKFIIILILFIFGIFLIPFTQLSAYGLSCTDPNIIKSFEESDVVFSGQAISKEYLESSDEFTFISVTLFSIKESFKGNYQDFIHVSSNEGFWGINFTEGLEYLVFANTIDNNFQSQLCGPTTLVQNSGIDFIRKISNNNVLPPLKQISNGIMPENIVCTEGYALVIKTTNNFPACVYFTSIEKLIQRGWAMNFTSTFSLDNVDSQLGNVNSEHEITERAKAILDYALAQEQSNSVGEYIEGPTDDGYPIAFYDVSGNDIILNKLPSLPSDLLYLQQDTEKHQEIWNVFTKLIPESSRNVNVFYLTTDGEDGIGGGVERDIDNISMWNLFYDILDAYPTGILDDKEIIYTTIHEYGHIVTSDTDQIDIDLELINTFTDENFDKLFQIKSESCNPSVLVYDGCAKSTSYINLFYQKFWIDIISEWNEIQYIEDDEEFYEQSNIFYQKYENRFLTMYSSTNIDEDIAESWTVFVLHDKPINDTISDQKILFFYDFQELVDLREYIRNRL